MMCNYTRSWPPLEFGYRTKRRRRKERERERERERRFWHFKIRGATRSLPSLKLLRRPQHLLNEWALHWAELGASQFRHLSGAPSFLPSPMNGFTRRLAFPVKVISGIIFERDNPNTRARARGEPF